MLTGDIALHSSFLTLSSKLVGGKHALRSPAITMSGNAFCFCLSKFWPSWVDLMKEITRNHPTALGGGFRGIAEVIISDKRPDFFAEKYISIIMRNLLIFCVIFLDIQISCA